MATTIIIRSVDISDEEILLLAKMKGYQMTILSQIRTPETTDDSLIPVTTEMEEIPNPQSPAEFLRQVYEGMITGDIGRELIRYNDSIKEEEWRKMDEAIMQKASSKITSEII